MVRILKILCLRIQQNPFLFCSFGVLRRIVLAYTLFFQTPCKPSRQIYCFFSSRIPLNPCTQWHIAALSFEPSFFSFLLKYLHSWLPPCFFCLTLEIPYTLLQTSVKYYTTSWDTQQNVYNISNKNRDVLWWDKELDCPTWHTDRLDKLTSQNIDLF